MYRYHDFKEGDVVVFSDHNGYVVAPSDEGVRFTVTKIERSAVWMHDPSRNLRYAMCLKLKKDTRATMVDYV